MRVETGMTETAPSIWANRGFRAYLNSTAFTGMAFAMQQLLVSWLLIGVLLLPADRVGLLQALMGLPGIFLMLWGGASADRQDPRRLLMVTYALAPVLPVFLLLTDRSMGLAVWSVMLWGLGMSVVASFSMPAQQAILNRVSGKDVQRGVSASTAVGFLVQVAGLALAGQMDRIGLTSVLVVQAVCLATGALMIRRIDAVPGPGASTGHSPIQTIIEGLKATYKTKVIFHVLSINFASSIFNAGAFMTVFPFIIKRVYDGDALLLAMMMAVFFAGAMVSNVIMFRLMPFQRPGRLFLLMQLSRIVVLFLLWIEPSWWLLVVAIVGWGVNMGFTTTLARAIVQESAAPEYRGRVLSVFALGMMGSTPIGAIVLGWVIETFGTLNALIPAMAVSAVLCLVGILFTDIWRYRS
jgi:predicted MFS family arabinose efflux permease